MGAFLGFSWCLGFVSCCNTVSVLFGLIVLGGLSGCWDCVGGFGSCVFEGLALDFLTLCGGFCMWGLCGFWVWDLLSSVTCQLCF